ncbi:alpha/beta hydrolase [Saccharopolyspora shandongensis]|uniref:alpha/beta fold hydrolase n=1 Tax=Saccharopolyspora shandongensis TaxID=418495 RepID=UPI00343F5087
MSRCRPAAGFSMSVAGASTSARTSSSRSSAFVDAEHDRIDRDAGRRLTMPVLAMWQDPGDAVLPFDPQRVWADWAPDLRTHVLPCGHFLPEERPDEVTAAIRDLIGEDER